MNTQNTKNSTGDIFDKGTSTICPLKSTTKYGVKGTYSLDLIMTTMLTLNSAKTLIFPIISIGIIFVVFLMAFL